MRWTYRVGYKNYQMPDGGFEKIYGIVEAYYETDPLEVIMVSGFQEVWGSTYRDAEWCAKEMLKAFEVFGVEGVLNLDSFGNHSLDSFENRGLDEFDEVYNDNL